MAFQKFWVSMFLFFSFPFSLCMCVWGGGRWGNYLRHLPIKYLFSLTVVAQNVVFSSAHLLIVLLGINAALKADLTSCWADAQHSLVFQASHPILYWTLKAMLLILVAHSLISVPYCHDIRGLVVFVSQDFATWTQFSPHLPSLLSRTDPFLCSSIHENICGASMAGTM